MESRKKFTREYNKFGADVALGIKNLGRFPYLRINYILLKLFLSTSNFLSVPSIFMLNYISR